jgi:hypothetical protein
MDISIKEMIIDQLKGVRRFHRTSLNQYAMRCPLCGDSKKDPSKTRFYLKIDTTNELPIVYNCFNCDSSGILTPDILRAMDVNNLSLNSNLLKFNKMSIKSIQKRVGISKKKLNVKVPTPIYNKRNELKKLYIEKRLGLELTFAELVRLKCVFSLEEFVKVNDIEKLTVGNKMANMLNDYYVGFLTTNNEYINYRDCTNNNQYRYYKYALLPSYDETTKMYNIPTQVPVLTTEIITINIAEGIFDILGIYYHIMNKEEYNNIYMAVCGCGFMSVIKYFIRIGLIGNNITINIYSDSDKEQSFYDTLFKYAKQWFGEINLIYNTKSKDYGVPSKYIDLYKINIKRRILNPE